LEKKVLIAALFILSFCGYGRAEFEEYTLKALFLEATTRFINWPDSTRANLPLFSDTNEPFIIAVLGEDTMIAVLKKTFKDKTIKGKRVEIRAFSAVSEIPQCHMLFIPQSMKKMLPLIIPITNKWPILTMGDTPGYSEKGIILNLFLEGSKVRFKINEDAARLCGLKISYLLLKMGKVVPSGGGEG
jgi:hypothetical protein